MKKLIVVLFGLFLLACSKEAIHSKDLEDTSAPTKPVSTIVSASDLVGDWTPFNGGETITISKDQSAGADKFILHEGNTNLIATQKADGGLYVFDDKLIDYDESQHQILYKLNRYKRK